MILAEETLLRKASVPKVHIDKLIWCLISLVSEIPTLVDSRWAVFTRSCACTAMFTVFLNAHSSLSLHVHVHVHLQYGA